MYINTDMSSSAAQHVPIPESRMGAPSKKTKNAANKAEEKSRMHRRSRTGCFTCRLRRKKCDEGKPFCKACKNLGLQCEYKRPMWWSNGEQRRSNKEAIKDKIRRTQSLKKNANAVTASPPGLCHSVPTSDGCSESKSNSRSGSISTPYHEPQDYDFSHITPDFFNFPMPAIDHNLPGHFPMFSPYEVDVKTERQLFINDQPTRRDSTISTYSTYQPPPMSSGTATFGSDTWVQENHFEMQHELFQNDTVDYGVFDFGNEEIVPKHEAVIDVNDDDRPFLKHFIDEVAKLLFPVLDANQHGSALRDVILPALETNKCYSHCCLSIAALHMKASQNLDGELIDGTIMHHRYETISALCEALSQDDDHMQILEATLGMIFFQCSVGKPKDDLPDIPWHQHFNAAADLVKRLELQSTWRIPNTATTPPGFSMALTAWIDILGSTMLRRSPTFADTYRELNITKRELGLAELMGCEDRIMFLISEIACLEARKAEGMQHEVLCGYIELLGIEISTGPEPRPSELQNAILPSGEIRPKQLSINMTCVYRLATRIYLCMLVPGANIGRDNIMSLVTDFTEAMDYIPGGPEGFDRSLIWPLLIAGSVSLRGSRFRSMFTERCKKLGEGAKFGSMGRINELFKDLWINNDASAERGDYQSVHWRDVMRQKGWDSLLI